MIIALIGGTELAHEHVYKQLMQQPRSMSVRVSSIPRGPGRIKRIRNLLAENENKNNFIITGLAHNEEVKMIRSMGG